MEIEEYVEFIRKKHNNQNRIQGTPYYLHPVEVSKILKQKGFSKDYQIAGLFHDLLEDTDTTYEEILKISNLEIAEAVRLVTKEKGYISFQDLDITAFLVYKMYIALIFEWDDKSKKLDEKMVADSISEIIKNGLKKGR